MTPERLRPRSLTDLVELVPNLLGFHPSESLVLLVIRDGMLVLTARVDLPAADDLPAVVDRLAPAWERHPGADLLLLAFSQDAARAWYLLEDFALRVPDAVPCGLAHADGERCFVAPDAAGTPYDPRSGVLAAEATYQGLMARPSRDDLYALIEPGPAESDRRAAHARARRSGSASELARHAAALLEDVCRARRPLSLDEAAVLGVALGEQGFRDRCAWSTSTENADARCEVWSQVARGGLPETTGNVLALLGLSAWVSGQGALQVVCMERMEALDADPCWAGFLELVNASVAPPSLWETIRADYVCAQLAAREAKGDVA